MAFTHSTVPPWLGDATREVADVVPPFPTVQDITRGLPGLSRPILHMRVNTLVSAWSRNISAFFPKKISETATVFGSWQWLGGNGGL